MKFHYGEIRLPIFEPTELFARSVGLDTDIVSKEMYTFEDYESSELLEHRNAVLTWRESPNVPSPPGPLGVGAFAIFSPFAGLVSRFHALAKEGFDKAQIPRTPENERLLNFLTGEREIFISSVQSGSVVQNLQAVNALKQLVRQVTLGDSLTLRPEATASVVRAYIEHGMHTWPSPVRLYYIGPMFRRERPQKGRYRQFYQIGAELLGSSDDPSLDAEVIEMLLDFFARVNLQGAKLYINSIGDKNCRPAYVKRLRGELQKVRDKLGADSQRRIETNPLRVLDSKLPEEQLIIDKLPRIAECLCDACREHYEELKRQLALRKIAYEENWRLVRGLDYYMRTTFEITAPGLGSQNAVCGGGRYDGLVELLGGAAATKGIGFAIGTDRLILSLQNQGIDVSSTTDVLMAWMDAASHQEARSLASILRDVGLIVDVPAKALNPREALGLANKRNIPIGVVIGANEVSAGVFNVRLLSEREQVEVKVDSAPDLARLLVFRALLEKVLRHLAKGLPEAPQNEPLGKLTERLAAANMVPGTVKLSVERALEIFNRVAHSEDVNQDERSAAVANALFALQGLSRFYGPQIPFPAFEYLTSSRKA